jgi:hypothetical protein
MGFAFAKDPASNPYQFHALLLAAWVTLILGWTYVVNDQKISAIGEYTRESLKNAFDSEDKNLFGWEWFHAEDEPRWRRKFEQLVIDELSFTVVGIVAVFLFLFLSPNYGRWSVACAAMEIFLLFVLGCEIVFYAKIGPHGRASKSGVGAGGSAKRRRSRVTGA